MLRASMRAEQAAADGGHAALLFLGVPWLGWGRMYPWRELVGPRPYRRL